MQLRGAEARLRRERELTWFGAMLPHMKKPPTLDEFAGRKVSHHERVKAFHAAWDKIDRALARHY